MREVRVVIIEDDDDDDVDETPLMLLLPSRSSDRDADATEDEDDASITASSVATTGSRRIIAAAAAAAAAVIALLLFVYLIVHGGCLGGELAAVVVLQQLCDFVGQSGENRKGHSKKTKKTFHKHFALRLVGRRTAARNTAVKKNPFLLSSCSAEKKPSLDCPVETLFFWSETRRQDSRHRVWSPRPLSLTRTQEVLWAVSDEKKILTRRRARTQINKTPPPRQREAERDGG